LQERQDEMKDTKASPLSRHRIRNTVLAAAATGGLLWSADSFALTKRASDSHPISFRDAQAQAREFIRENERMTLTPAQQKVMTQALSSVPASCCAQYSVSTCCCPCNLARSVWGLSKTLIQKHGASESQVRRAVTEWLTFINPRGSAGNACFTGGCDRPFHKDGCGGMDAKTLL
jgi:hypothetical protein